MSDLRKKLAEILHEETGSSDGLDAILHIIEAEIRTAEAATIERIASLVEQYESPTSSLGNISNRIRALSPMPTDMEKE
jgi:hypothetical protein